MANDAQRVISLLIELHGQQEVQRALDSVTRRANQTENATRSLSGSVSNLGDRLSAVGGPIGAVGDRLSDLANSARAVAGTGGLGAIAIAAAAAGAGLVALSDHAVRAANETAMLANKLDFTTERFMALSLVANATGGDVEKYRETLNSLAQNMTDAATGADSQNKSLANLGLRYADLAKMTPEEQLRALIKAYDDLDHSQAATAALQQYLGEEFKEVAQMVRGGEDAIRKAAEMNAYYGVTADENLIKKGKESQEATTRMELAFTGLQQSIAKGLGNPFTDFKLGLAEVGKMLNDLYNKYAAFRTLTNGLAAGGIGAAIGGVGGAIVGGGVGLLAGGVGVIPGAIAGAKLGAAAGGAFGVGWGLAGNNKTGSAATDNLPAGPKTGAGYNMNNKAAAEARVAAANKELEAKKKADEAAKKAASEAEAAQKRAQANAERISQLGKDSIVDAERQLLTSERASKEDMARFETTKGRLKEIKQSEKDSIIALAKQQDEQDKLNEKVKKRAEEEKKANKVIEDRIKKLKDDGAEAASRLAGVGEAAIRKSSLERRSVGLGAVDRDTLASIDAAAADAERGREKLRIDLGDAIDGESLLAYQKALEEINNKEQELSLTLQSEGEKRKAMQADIMVGAKNAIATYVDGASNIAAQMEQVGTNLFKGMEDALVNFVTTGKLSFSDLARSVIADFARMQAKAAVSGILGYLGKALGMGGGGGVSIAESSLPALQMPTLAALPTFANGGAFSGGTQFFAGGDVVNRATSFGMSNGRKGVMGEAGPEAILPLTRGADGKLGVTMSGGSGGGQTISIGDIYVQGGSTNEETAAALRKELLDTVPKMAKQAIANEKNRPGGILYTGR